jgi:hypothetical protein
MSALYPRLVFNATYFEGGMCFAGEALFVAGEGLNKDYGDDDPEYQRIAAEFGYDQHDDEDDGADQNGQEGT